MSRLQKVFLVLACVFFAATIYSLFFLKILFIIIFLVLHSICLYVFCYLCFTDQMDKAVTFDIYHKKIGLELERREREISLISGRMHEKDGLLGQANAEIEELKDTNDSLKNDVENQMIRIRKLEEENQKLSIELEKKEEHKEEQHHSSDDYGALLPPIPPDSDEKQTVNIISIANQAKDSLMDNAMKANLRIMVSSPSDSILVSADPNRLMTLFRNIIDNSIKYMRRAGSLVITISTIGDDIFIVLKDTGEGLPDNETKYIFELNYQGSNRISGNGLGLAQARAIVEYYGGTIYAKSTVGNGMGIYIQIPSGGRV